ncbi:TNF receptor-associated factor 1 [Leptodactylus fuscus]|uniref:TNF receptor-associated factor 1 n=1 Tax=Leptodactylus fuscus TaxID=238119 RepID=UPI003F4EF0ED
MAQTRISPGSAPHENEFVLGYPTSICDHEPGTKYLCCKCKLVLKMALQTLCGHRYCSSCLAWMVRSCESPICPRCEEEPSSVTADSYLAEDKAFSDAAINKEISELGVHCLMTGCKWSGVLREYEDHQAVCDFALIRCHTGCGETIQRRFLADHLQSDCPNNSVRCPSVSERISRHQSENNNGENIFSEDPRSQKSDQSKDKTPPPASTHCRFAALGCSYRGSRAQVRDHEMSAVALHMSLVLPVLLQVRSSVSASALVTNGFCDRNGADWKLSPSVYNGESVQEIATDFGHHNGDVSGSDLISRICALETRIQVAENIIMVMNREIDSSSAKLTSALEQIKQEQCTVRACEAKIADLRCTIAKKDIEMNDLHVQMANLEQTSYDGIFLWKISDLTRKCQDASTGRTVSLYSPAFYTARYGYKVSLRVYLNGDGAGRGTHISLFFTIMRGEYDALLSWPFKHKVTFMLLDQSNREHIIDAFRPDTMSISFQRPVSDINIASGCPLFCPLSKLQPARSSYVRDDTMFIRCIIDTST